MKLTYNNTPLTLEDEPLDVGYSAEKVELSTKDDKKVTVGGHTNRTQIIVSLPFADEAAGNELDALASVINETAAKEIDAYAVTAHGGGELGSGYFTRLVDADEAFGDYYGIRIADGELAGRLAKALFIIAQDGTLFYFEIPEAVENGFDAERFTRHIVTALSCCNKEGCHS